MECSASKKIQKLEERISELEELTEDEKELDSGVAEAKRELDAKIDEFLEHMDQVCICDTARQYLDAIGMLQRALSNAEMERGKKLKKNSEGVVANMADVQPSA